ncbi:hypothetical protein MtrunA17_Chr8g0377471 [Medicago truncatula]|uniref:Uncharacterized protein n=1 Tax=Medicago truncatula TaxID=3880 RepID=A0A396GN18_MEDTR|nr:hypothetical protein MtrunA17_Chr8g0377471 [Medicago truncatula]
MIIQGPTNIMYSSTMVIEMCNVLVNYSCVGNWNTKHIHQAMK